MIIHNKIIFYKFYSARVSYCCMTSSVIVSDQEHAVHEPLQRKNARNETWQHSKRLVVRITGH